MSVAAKGILGTLLSDPGFHHTVICNNKMFSECYLEHNDFFYNSYSEIYFLPNVAPCKGNFQSSCRTPGFCQNVPRGKKVLSQCNKKTGYFKMSLGMQRLRRYVIRNKTIFREWHSQDKNPSPKSDMDLRNLPLLIDQTGIAESDKPDIFET
jgi:hypothetical protein